MISKVTLICVATVDLITAAPQTGVVQQLAMHAKGAVIGAGEQIMLIVPEADALVVEVRVDRR